MRTILQILIAVNIAISTTYASGFFKANGDNHFKKLNITFTNLTCRKYSCEELGHLFLRLNEEFEKGAKSDQQVISILKKVFLTELKDIRVSSLSSKRVKRILDLAQSQGLIDSVQHKILVTTVESKKSEETFGLAEYERKLKSIKRKRGEELPNDLFSPLNDHDVRKRIKALEDETARQRLYSRYSAIQIRQMAEVLSNAIDLMTARQGRVQLDLEGDDIWDRTETLSSQEIYRLGMKLLYRDYTRLKSSPLFQKNDLHLIDLVSAALEGGNIDSEVVREVLAMDALKIVEKGFFERHRKTFSSLGKIGVTYFAPGGPLIVMAITLVESMAEGKKDYEKFYSDHLF